MSAELNIPDEAVTLAAEQIRAVAASCCRDAALAANVAGSAGDWMGEAQAALKAAAPLIVAAELDRQAGELRAEAARLTSKLDSMPDEAAFAVGAANGALSKQARRMEDRAAELRGAR